MSRNTLTMTTTKTIAVLFLITNVAHCQLSTGDQSGMSEIDELRYYFQDSFQTIWNDIEESNDINSPGISDGLLLEKFKSFAQNISDIEGIIEKQDVSILQRVLSYAQLEAQIVNMHAFFETFKRFQREQVRMKQQLAWSDIAMYFLDSSKNGVRTTIDRLHSHAIPESEKTIFMQSLQETRKYVCEMEQSEQQMIYNLYNMVSIAELKGYTMLNFAWMLLKLYDKGNFTSEVNLMKKLYTERTLQKVNAARYAMQGADRSLYKCDPKNWIEGENYVRVTKLLQGYIENEVNLNPQGTCGENCNYYQVTEYHGCFKQQFCAKQRPCQGQVVRCTFVDSDMNICKSTSDDRRYDFVEYENGSILGKKGTCNARNLFKVDSWWRYLFWHCSYCFCYCDDNHPSSDRYFNLRDVTSDTANNKVVTGVRIVKQKQVIHLQIQQGELMERGAINKSSIEWVPVRNYSVMDHDVEDGVDYHTMNFKERSLDLDDVIAPSDHILTGVRFRKIGSHLNLEIRGTPFHFATGKVRSGIESTWFSNDNTDGSLQSPRTEIIMPNPDVPTRRGAHLPDSRHDQYIQFRESSTSADAAQSTVPFLDAQPLESKGMPLSGVGVYHRGTLNSGGFVALKLMTFDFSSHMVPQQPENLT